MTGIGRAVAADDPRAALRRMLREGTPHGSSAPRVARDELLRLLSELRGEAVAAMASRGVPADVAEESLDDIPRKASLYGDLVDDDWLLQIFCGCVLALGRLQFERDAGGHGRHIHIPEAGPLTPAAVDASLDRARAFFGDGAALVCESWVFDPALDVLPGASNLRRFADRFDVRPAKRTAEGARSLAKFVFRATPERAVATPLRKGASAVERIAYRALSNEGVWSEPRGILR
ncbi:hypothetical protein [Leifsonia xyli]|uniref:hypothetical protein n=1 Tax=Leifsonia xyli TaxID=1575 RepID=UPI003D67ECE6